MTPFKLQVRPEVGGSRFLLYVGNVYRITWCRNPKQLHSVMILNNFCFIGNIRRICICHIYNIIITINVGVLKQQSDIPSIVRNNYSGNMWKIVYLRLI